MTFTVKKNMSSEKLRKSLKTNNKDVFGKPLFFLKNVAKIS